MPKHPLYVDFLAEDAQKVIGEVHPQTVPARRVLESEGLRYQATSISSTAARRWRRKSTRSARSDTAAW